MITMKEIELELCLMDIYSEIVEYVYLDDDEIMDFVAEDGVVNFLVAKLDDMDWEQEYQDTVATITPIFEFDLVRGEIEFDEDFVKYLPVRIAEDIMDSFYELVEKYENYETKGEV